MKYLKNLSAFFIPLFSMLCAFSIYLIIDNVVDNYKEKISKDYSIVVVSKKPLVKENINISGITVKELEALDKDKIVDNFKSNLSNNSIKLLKNRLPHFYKVYLESFPTTSEINKIKEYLLQNKNIKEVEVFSKNHNQVYLLLTLMNSISFILFFIITIFAIIIIAKQVKLWFHEHSTRISILKLHGASTLYSASSLLRYAITSSILAVFIVSIFLYLISSNLTIIFPSELNDILIIKFDYTIEVIKIIALSFGISMFTILGVLFKYKIDNE